MEDHFNKVPEPDITPPNDEPVEYAGFWRRFGASVIDSILILIIICPLLAYIYGMAYLTKETLFAGTWDVLLKYALPAIRH